MKSIKNLTVQTLREKPSQLASIDGASPIRNKRQRLQVMCAFHPTEIITNFCKNPNCLLPLCPKCVKIHVEQHAESGSFAKFQAIEDCLDQAHSAFLNSFSQISKLQKTSIQIEDNYQKKKQSIFRDFERAKMIAFQFLQDIFKDYQEAIKFQITKDDRVFTEHLIEYHDSISSMMENCRNATKKFNNRNTLMEGLIGFYSKGNYVQGLKQCEEKLNKLTMSKVQIITLQHSLDKMKDVIQRYIRIGQNQVSLEQMANENQTLKSITVDDSISKMYKSDLNRQRINGATSSMSYNQNGRDLSQFLNNNFLNLKTPLDNFSLQRSRDTRISLKGKSIGNEN